MVSLWVAACSKDDASKESASAEQAHASAEAPNEHGTPIVVREAGVRFDPPPAWPRARYRVETQFGSGADAKQAGAGYWVAVQYRPEQPGHKEASLCRIVVFKREEWLRIGAEPGPPVGTTIDSVATWVYVAQLPQANPYPEGSPDAEQFGAMRLSIRDVRAGFTVEGEGPGAYDAVER